ncbi:MAG: lipopolysaccharide biosynthesis protein [Syntrophales bacterium]
MQIKSQEAISVRRNTVANYVGTFCRVLLGFLFVPLYINYLGIESYGLIGFSVSLSALLSLADLGLSATLSREFARYSILPEAAERMRSLLKTLQTVYWGISLLVGLIIVAVAPLIARYWINPGTLNTSVVQNAVVLMGLTAALQGPMSLYIGGIFGLQRHVLGNFINITLAILRFGGVVLALALLSPTLNIFFSFQLSVALIGALGSGMILWGLLPHTGIPSHFQISQLKSVWRFAAGMSINSVLWLILSQLDKIILIKMLPLQMFGYYAVASTVATVTVYLGGPLFTTFLPRYTQLYAAGDDEGLKLTYRISCRLNALIIIPTVTILALFSEEALLIWTRNPDIAEHTQLLLSLLVIGYGLNQLAYLPFALQVASGWVNLGVYTNASGVLIIVPALVIATCFYGAVGAAAVWIALNCIYVFIYVNILHGRILKGEARQWYLGIMLPLVLSLGVGLLGRGFLPAVAGAWPVVSISLMWFIIVVATVLATSHLREKIPVLFSKKRGDSLIKTG